MNKDGVRIVPLTNGKMHLRTRRDGEWIIGYPVEIEQ